MGWQRHYSRSNANRQTNPRLQATDVFTLQRCNLQTIAERSMLEHARVVACRMQHENFLLPGPGETSLTLVQVGILQQAAPCRTVQVLAAVVHLQWTACDAIPRGLTSAMYSRSARSQ